MRLPVGADHLDPLECDLMYGRAGLLYTLLHVRRHCGATAVPEDTLRHEAQQIIITGVTPSPSSLGLPAAPSRASRGRAGKRHGLPLLL